MRTALTEEFQCGLWKMVTWAMARSLLHRQVSAPWGSGRPPAHFVHAATVWPFVMEVVQPDKPYDLQSTVVVVPNMQ